MPHPPIAPEKPRYTLFGSHKGKRLTGDGTSWLHALASFISNCDSPPTVQNPWMGILFDQEQGTVGRFHFAETPPGGFQKPVMYSRVWELWCGVHQYHIPSTDLASALETFRQRVMDGTYKADLPGYQVPLYYREMSKEDIWDNWVNGNGWSSGLDKFTRAVVEFVMDSGGVFRPQDYNDNKSEVYFCEAPQTKGTPRGIVVCANNLLEAYQRCLELVKGTVFEPSLEHTWKFWKVPEKLKFRWRENGHRAEMSSSPPTAWVSAPLKSYLCSFKRKTSAQPLHLMVQAWDPHRAAIEAVNLASEHEVFPPSDKHPLRVYETSEKEYQDLVENNRWNPYRNPVAITSHERADAVTLRLNRCTPNGYGMQGDKLFAIEPLKMVIRASTWEQALTDFFEDDRGLFESEPTTKDPWWVYEITEDEFQEHYNYRLPADKRRLPDVSTRRATAQVIGYTDEGKPIEHVLKYAVKYLENVPELGKPNTYQWTSFGSNGLDEAIDTAEGLLGNLVPEASDKTPWEFYEFTSEDLIAWTKGLDFTRFEGRDPSHISLYCRKPIDKSVKETDMSTDKYYALVTYKALKSGEPGATKAEPLWVEGKTLEEVKANAWYAVEDTNNDGLGNPRRAHPTDEHPWHLHKVNRKSGYVTSDEQRSLMKKACTELPDIVIGETEHLLHVYQKRGSLAKMDTFTGDSFKGLQKQALSVFGKPNPKNPWRISAYKDGKFLSTEVSDRQGLENAFEEFEITAGVANHWIAAKGQNPVIFQGSPNDCAFHYLDSGMAGKEPTASSPWKIYKSEPGEVEKFVLGYTVDLSMREPVATVTGLDIHKIPIVRKATKKPAVVRKLKIIDSLGSSSNKTRYLIEVDGVGGFFVRGDTIEHAAKILRDSRPNPPTKTAPWSVYEIGDKAFQKWFDNLGNHFEITNEKCVLKLESMDAFKPKATPTEAAAKRVWSEVKEGTEFKPTTVYCVDKDHWGKEITKSILVEGHQPRVINTEEELEPMAEYCFVTAEDILQNFFPAVESSRTMKGAWDKFAKYKGDQVTSHTPVSVYKMTSKDVTEMKRNGVKADWFNGRNPDSVVTTKEGPGAKATVASKSDPKMKTNLAKDTKGVGELSDLWAFTTQAMVDNDLNVGVYNAKTLYEALSLLNPQYTSTLSEKNPGKLYRLTNEIAVRLGTIKPKDLEGLPVEVSFKHPYVFHKYAVTIPGQAPFMVSVPHNLSEKEGLEHVTNTTAAMFRKSTPSVEAPWSIRELTVEEHTKWSSSKIRTQDCVTGKQHLVTGLNSTYYHVEGTATDSNVKTYVTVKAGTPQSAIIEALKIEDHGLDETSEWTVYAPTERELKELASTGVLAPIPEDLSKPLYKFTPKAKVWFDPVGFTMHETPGEVVINTKAIKSMAIAATPAGMAIASTPSVAEIVKSDLKEIALRAGVRQVRNQAQRVITNFWSKKNKPQRLPNETDEVYNRRVQVATEQTNHFFNTEMGQGLLAYLVGGVWTMLSEDVEDTDVKTYGDLVAHELRVSGGTDLLDGVLTEVVGPVITSLTETKEKVYQHGATTKVRVVTTTDIVTTTGVESEVSEKPLEHKTETSGTRK